MRTNLTQGDPAKLWSYYLQLVRIEQAFKTLKGDLAIRPIFHQQEARIEAHIFIAFLAYCLHVTLGRRLHALAPGLTPRSVLEKFAALQMIDLHVPTTDGRELLLTRYTEPEPDLMLLLEKLRLRLPASQRPKSPSNHPAGRPPRSADLRRSKSRNIKYLGIPNSANPRSQAKREKRNPPGLAMPSLTTIRAGGRGGPLPDRRSC